MQPVGGRGSPPSVGNSFENFLFRLLRAEGSKRRPVQRHPVQVQLFGHAELRGGGGRGGGRLRAPASPHGHPAAQPPAAGVAG